MTETIVCLASRHVETLGLREGFTRTQAGLLDRLFANDQIWLGPRDWLENDETYRQLVSYVVFRHQRSLLIYRRAPKGGETRLHGRLSVGVGGHVNVSDIVSKAGSIDLLATLQRACGREIAEEIECGAIDQLETIGVICESVNAVSRVHLGIVMECRLSQPNFTLLDPGLVDGHFVAATELAGLTDRLETWSSALVPYFVQQS